MTRKPPRIIGTPAPAKADLVIYHFPCGCVAEGTRANRVERCLVGPCVYSPTRPPGNVRTLRQ